jgi:predicted DNA-binding WGR domain protein
LFPSALPSPPSCLVHGATSDGIRIDRLSEILIELHACDPATNRRRAWRVVAGADLFGRWTAQVTFGRIGAAGRTVQHEFASETAAVAFVRRSLRRRATAVRRLGVPYRPVEASPEADQLLVLTGLRRPAP